MAAYARATDYSFDMFETRYERSNAAPKREEKKRPQLEVVEPAPQKERRRQAVSSARISFRIVVAAVLMLAVLCLQISAGAKRYELSREIAKVESEIKVAKSENVRLTAVLSGYTSISKIDDYAQNILGMTKLEGYQVEYIDLSEDDGVIYSVGTKGILSVFSGN